jgi:hypothetical protein
VVPVGLEPAVLAGKDRSEAGGAARIRPIAESEATLA